jgi:hypothetical protein
MDEMEGYKKPQCKELVVAPAFSPHGAPDVSGATLVPTPDMFDECSNGLFFN